MTAARAERGPSAGTIGARIRERREAMGLSQGELAKMVGVRDFSVSRWENNRSVPHEHATRLGRALRVNAEWILHGGAQPADPVQPETLVEQWIRLAPEGSSVTDEERSWLESVPVPTDREIALLPFYRNLLVAHRSLPTPERHKATRALAFSKYVDENADDPDFWRELMRHARARAGDEG